MPTKMYPLFVISSLKIIIRNNIIITSKIEHPAVLDTLHKLEKEGFEVTYVGVDSEGIINLDELKSAIKPTTTLITVMYNI